MQSSVAYFEAQQCTVRAGCLDLAVGYCASWVTRFYGLGSIYCDTVSPAPLCLKDSSMAVLGRETAES
jgi:hypothetical protein